MRIKSHRVNYPRLTLLYLTLFVAMTLFLFSSAVSTLSEKQAEVMSLRVSNIELKGESLAAELKRQIWKLSDIALNDVALQELISLQQSPASAREDRLSRTLSEQIRQRHPIVREVVVVTDERIFASASLGSDSQRAIREQTALAERGQTSTGVVLIDASYGQLFFKAIGGPGTVGAFLINERWIGEVLLRDVSLSSGFDEVTAGQIRLQDSKQESSGKVVTIRLAGSFPARHIAIPEQAISRQKAKAARETVSLMIACLIFFLVLGAGLVLILRVIHDLRAKKSRADFMSAFSHELKNPLTLIRLYSEMLQEEALEPESRKSYCDIIERQSDRLCKLLGRLLDAQSLEMGRKQYVMVEGDFAKTVADTVREYAEHLELRGFHLDIELARRLPPLTFDKEAVSQAVLNLMDNARKYSGENKYIGVRLWQESRNVILEVEDQGDGIPPDQQQKIFEGFYRVPSASIRQGFGLGLFLVNHIMLAHKGKVEVDSRVGIGTRFRLVFPTSEPGIRTFLQKRLAGLQGSIRVPQRTLRQRPDKAA